MKTEIIKKFEDVKKFEMSNFEKLGRCEFTVLMLDEKPDGKLIAGMMLTSGGMQDFLENRFDYLYKAGRAIRNEKRLNIVAVISASEAWLSKVHKDKQESYAENIKLPSNDPNKIEALIFNVMDSEGENIMYVHEIKSKDGKRYVEPKSMGQDYDKLENILLGSFWKGHKGFVKTEKP